MFALLKPHHSPESPAKQVYGKILAYARNPFFFAACGVPDDFEGRFDLLTLCIFLVMRSAGDKAFSQSLFDVMFADMDQTLREMGIGDMGVPKHMRRMMKAFNGRVHAYEAAIKADHLKEAVKKNIYGKKGAGDEELQNMMTRLMKTMENLDGQDRQEIIKGNLMLKEE